MTSKAAQPFTSKPAMSHQTAPPSRSRRDVPIERAVALATELLAARDHSTAIHGKFASLPDDLRQRAYQQALAARHPAYAAAAEGDNQQ